MTRTQTPGRPRRSCEWERTKKKNNETIIKINKMFMQIE